jgi:hypothetical protein
MKEKELIKALSALHEERERVTQRALQCWKRLEEFIVDKLDKGTIVTVSKDIIIEITELELNSGNRTVVAFRTHGFGDYGWTIMPRSSAEFGEGFYTQTVPRRWIEIADRPFTLKILRNCREIVEKVKQHLAEDLALAEVAEETIKKL